MHLALDRTVPLLRIAQAPDTAAAITAAVVTRDHTAPREAVLTADIAGVTPEGGPIHTTHHDHGPLDDDAIGHDSAEGIDPAIEVGLNPREDALVIDPVLQITNVPGML